MKISKRQARGLFAALDRIHAEVMAMEATETGAAPGVWREEQLDIATQGGCPLPEPPRNTQLEML